MTNLLRERETLEGPRHNVATAILRKNLVPAAALEPPTWSFVRRPEGPGVTLHPFIGLGA